MKNLRIIFAISAILCLFFCTLQLFAQSKSPVPLWYSTSSFPDSFKIADPLSDTSLWINKQMKFTLGGHWLAAHESVQKRLHLNTHHNHNWTWHLFNNPVAHRGQLFLDIPADDEYAPMIIRAPMLMNDTPYVFPRDDISAIEFHPEIAQKERNILIYHIICICCFFFRS